MRCERQTLDMSLDDVDVIGFMSSNDFEEGCQALQQLSLSSRQLALMIKIREEVIRTILFTSFQL